jgi:hypothetical protein
LQYNQNNILNEYIKKTSIESANDHEIVFFFGDLNYRISKNLKTSKVYKLIEQNELEELCQYDQLLIEIEKNNIFHGFYEGLLLLFLIFILLCSLRQCLYTVMFFNILMIF